MTGFTVALRITGDSSGGVQATVLQTRALNDLKQAQDQEAEAARRSTVATRSQSQALQQAASSTRQNQLAVRNLGFQISDIGTGLTSGQSPFIIFAQQGGQVAQALAGMRGALGAVGGFLAGPWGAALITAVALGGNFIRTLLDAEDAGNAHKKALDEQAEAFKRLRDAGQDAITTTREQTRETVKKAQASLQAALATREELSADLEAAKQRAQAAQREAGNDRGGRFAQSGVAFGASSDVAAIQRALTDNAANVQSLQETIFGGEKTLRDFRIKAAGDASEALRQSYEDEVALIEKRRKANVISEPQADSQRLAAQRRYQQALEQDDTSRRRQKDLRNAEIKAAEEQEQQNQRLAASIDGLLAKYQPYTAFLVEQKRRLDEVKEARRRGIGNPAQLDAIEAGIDSEQFTDRFKADPVKLKELDSLDARLRESGQQAERTVESYFNRLAEQQKAAQDAFIRIWDTARERVQGTLSDTIDDLLGGKIGSIGDFWKSFAAIGRRSIAETLAALVFSGGGQGAPGLPGPAGVAQSGFGIPGFSGGTIPLDGALGGLFGSSGPLGRLTRVIDDFGANLGFGGASGTGLGAEGLAGLDKLGLSGPKLAGSLSSALGGALQGAGVGGAVSGIGGLFGLKTSGIGGSIGGALGSFLPIPGGDIIGGILGGILGGLFGTKKRRGAATVTTAEDGVSLSNVYGGGTRDDTARSLGNQVGTSIRTLADSLQTTVVAGVRLGSIGTRDDKFTYDASGRGLTRESSVLKFDSAEEAVSAALFDALKRGAIELSEYGQRVVQTANDLNEATAKLQTVRAIEDLLGDPLAQPLSRQLQEFDSAAREQLRVAREAGFNLVEVERRQGEERAKVIADYSEQATRSLQSALDQLQFGGASPLSARERLDGQLGTFRTTLAAAQGGDQAKIDEAASLGVDLSRLAQDVFATGPEFARVYAEISAGLEGLKARTVESLAPFQPQAPVDSSGQALVAVNAEGFADVVQELRTLQGSVNALAGAVNSQASAARLSGVREAYTGARGLQIA